MPKYVLERDIPNVGSVTAPDVIAITQKFCSVLNNLGPKIQWLKSYVSQDRIYCVYIAPHEEMVWEYAKQGGFPANRVFRGQAGHRSPPWPRRSFTWSASALETQPAIHGQYLPGYELWRGGEEQDSLGNLFGAAIAAHRRLQGHGSHE
jgi:hypothetical protein